MLNATKKKTLAAVVGLAVVATGYGVASASPDPGCSEFAEKLTESAAFTPVELRRTSTPDPWLNPDGAQPPTASIVATLPGLSDGAVPTLQLEVLATSGASYSYFTSDPIEKLTVSEFEAKGGIQVHREPLNDTESFATYLLETLGDRAIPVRVGEYEAALVWADPGPRDVRTHNLYWSDGSYNYSLIAVMQAEEIVNLGRSLACG